MNHTAKAALERIEYRRGWDEADLNDFAIIEEALRYAEDYLEIVNMTEFHRYWFSLPPCSASEAIRRLLTGDRYCGNCPRRHDA